MKTEVEIKVQSIYYENDGEIKKHLYVSNDRLKISEAHDVLENQQVPYDFIVQVLAERAYIELSNEEILNKVTRTERFNRA